MMREQEDLLVKARDSVGAARVLAIAGYPEFAASRAYYPMFYVAEAFLLGKGLAFSKHAGVQAAFGQHFVKTGMVPSEYHRYLIRAMEVRHAGDYGKSDSVTASEAATQLKHAEEFLELAQSLIGSVPEEKEDLD
jgi:uncharacterized protein (UPF0332 family)